MLTSSEKYTVLIMMTTFNGELFLRAQIESIINQDYSGWELIVQDDGSDDSTIDILREYTEKDERIRFTKNQGRLHGAYYNFHSLINKCKNGKKYDFYMFCDQDDIWDTNKISILLTAITSLGETETPHLCYADMRLIDGSGMILGDSVDSLQGIKYKNKYSVFFSHKVYGCNLIANKTAFHNIPAVDTSKEETKILSHDNYFTKYVAVFGKIAYLPISTMSYRRHSRNVANKIAYGFGIKRIISRLSDIEDLTKDHALAYNQSLIAIQYFRPIANESQSNVLSSVERCIRRGGLSTVFFVIKHRISWGKPQKNISRIIGLVRGSYKKYLFQN